MFASICRRRRLLLALRRISAGGDGAARNRIHPSPSTILLSQLCSLTAAAPKSEPCPTTVSYLVSCGVSPATAAIRRVRIRDTDNADAVRNLLREYGLSDAEVTRTVGAEPQLLTFDPDRTLRPKLEFLLVSLGLQPRVIAAHPYILLRSLDKHLVPCVDFLRGILGTEDKVSRAISSNPRALVMADADNTMRPAVEALGRHGLSEESIAKVLLMNLGVLNTPIDRIAEAFEDLKELGMCATHSSFVYAFRAICSLKRETWRRKVALFGSFGVTDDVLIRAFKTQPTILLLSEETLTKKVRFFLDVLKLELNSIMQRPMLLSLSLENCIKPRCAVLSLLMREGKLEGKPNLIASLVCSARVFRERFVLKHADSLPIIATAIEGRVEFKGFGEREVELFSSRVTEAKRSITCNEVRL